MRLVHEELALQWVVSSGTARELAMANAWFLLELMVKSMTEHLAATDSQDAPRHAQGRLSEQFTDDVKTYYKKMPAKFSSLPDAVGLVGLKLDFLRIVCSHEHFVPLNVPFGSHFTPSSAPCSPTPSVMSSNSHSSFVSTLVGGDRTSFSELSLEFGLVVGDLAAVRTLPHARLHSKAVNMVCNLLTGHDSDPRYEEADCRARVAALYLQLLTIIMNVLHQLHGWRERGRSLLSPALEDGPEPQPGNNQSAAMAIAGTSMFGARTGASVTGLYDRTRLRASPA